MSSSTHVASIVRMLVILAMGVAMSFCIFASIFPFDHVVRTLSLRTQCGRQQSRILEACIAYAQQTASPWPLPAANAPASPQALAADAHGARLVTMRCLEVLRSVEGLPSGLFRCPQAGPPGQSWRPTANPAASASPAPSDWGSYAFDWACPGDPAASRVVFADRDATSHGTGCMLCYGDGHVAFAAATVTDAKGAGGAYPGQTLRTEGSDGRPVLAEVISPATARPPAGSADHGIYQADTIPSPG